MSAAIEAVYALLNDSERVMWSRAAEVAQDERRSPVEIALASDVTTLLSRNALARHVMTGPVLTSPVAPAPSDGSGDGD